MHYFLVKTFFVNIQISNASEVSMLDQGSCKNNKIRNGRLMSGKVQKIIKNKCIYVRNNKAHGGVGFELRVLCLQSRLEPYLHSILLLLILEVGSCELFSLVGLEP
jgi:hypothetical protein